MSTPLGVIRLDQPCQVPWDQMRGDDRTRFCTQCNLNVHNLSAMSEAEATAFVAMRDRRVCVAYQRLDDGSAVFAEASPAPQSPQVIAYETPSPRRRWLVPAAIVGALTTAGATAAYRSRPGPPVPVPAVLQKATITNTPNVAGGICPPQPVQFDPLSPKANLQCGVSGAQQIRDQLQFDIMGKALLAALPTGLEVVAVRYSTYPAGVKPLFGQVYVLGTPGETATSAPGITAIVWLLPKGTKLDAPPKPVNPLIASATLHYAATLGKHELFIESGDEELENIIRKTLLAADPLPKAKGKSAHKK